MSRFTNDADNVQIAMEQTVTMLISSVLAFVGTIAMMIYLNYILFLITLTVLVVDYIIVRKISKKSKTLFKRQQRNLGIVNAYVEEMVEGIKVVKAFNYEEEIKAEFTQKNQAYRDSAMHATYVGMIIMPGAQPGHGDLLCHYGGGGRSVRHQRCILRGRRGLYHRFPRRIPHLHQAGGHAHQPGLQPDRHPAVRRCRQQSGIFAVMDSPPEVRRGHHHHGSHQRPGRRDR